MKYDQDASNAKFEVFATVISRHSFSNGQPSSEQD